MSAFNYSKWDDIDTDSGSEEDAAAPSSSNTHNTPGDIFDNAAALFASNKTCECLNLYHDYLVNGLKIDRSHPLPTRSAKSVDGTMTPPNVLLRLYVNLAATHFQLEEFNDAHKYSSQGGVELLRDNGWMDKQQTSKLSLPVMLLRARAFQLSAVSLLSIGTASLLSADGDRNSVNKVRPMLLRAKGDFKQAGEFCEVLDSGVEGALELKQEVLQGASKLDSLLTAHFGKGEGGLKSQTNKNSSSSTELVEEMLNEVRVRLQKKQYSAVETAVDFVLSKNINQEVQAKALLLKCRALEMAGKLRQSAGVLEEAGGILGRGEKPKAFRKAGLTYLQVRDFENGKSVCALAEGLGEWVRCAASYLSLGHMQRYVGGGTGVAVECFEKATGMFEKGGELEQAGRTHLTVANVLKAVAASREEKEKVVEVLKKAAEAFKRGRKQVKGGGVGIGCMRGEVEACRAVAFCYRSYFDFDSGDSVDIDSVIEYFARCRAVAAVLERAGDKAGVQDLGRVSFEWANALKKRGAEGDLPRAKVGFQDAAKQFLTEKKPKEAEIAEEMLKRLRK
ncbi:hypothetical protein TL16_g08301 [Triparma laevis f. inornata]|uniref:Uncharacterized protein n=1 Tax=Triparma laevis f. inornata TaxID=1714386 RepID=A0A9W7B2F1_9STRA|nr:hypothetical protein TL16_g08301 [Triparma laevis f. inornata]